MPFVHLVFSADCLTQYFLAVHCASWCVTLQLRSAAHSTHCGRIFGSLWVSSGSGVTHCSCAGAVIDLACSHGAGSSGGSRFGWLGGGRGPLLGIYRNTAFRCRFRARHFIRTYSEHCKIHWLCQNEHFSSYSCALKFVGSTVLRAGPWRSSSFVRSLVRRFGLIRSSIVGNDFILLFVS